MVLWYCPSGFHPPGALDSNKRSRGGLREFGTRAKENMFRDLDLDLDLANTQVQSGYGPCVFRKKKKKTAMEINFSWWAT